MANDRPNSPLTIRGVILAEAVKLGSLRSPPWIIAAIVVVPVVLGAARAAVAAPELNADQEFAAAAALEAIAIGALPAAFLAAVLGLVAMGSEYVDDVLTGTFTVSPRRRLVVLAKCLPTLVASFLACLLSQALAGILAIVLLAMRGYDGFPFAHMVAIAFGAATSAALLSVLGVASAALTRSLVSAAVQLACLLALAPTAIGIAGSTRAQWLSNLLPTTAIQTVVTRDPAAPFTIEGALPSTLPWWGGLLVLVVWVFAYVAAALARIQRRAVSAPHVPRRARRRVMPVSATSGATGLGAMNVLRSEALKLVTLPPTWWLLGLSTVAVAAIAVLRASNLRPEDVLGQPILSDDLALATADQQALAISGGIGLAQLLISFFGAVAFTSEFSSGNIRPALVAVPRRSLLLLAKLGVAVIAAAAAAFVAHVLAALLATPLQHRQGFEATLDAPIVLETILKCVLASALVAGIGFAAGVLLRTPVASISALVGAFVVSHTALGPLQVLARGTPFVWLANLDEVFPTAVVAVQTIPANTYWPLFLEGSVLQFNPDQHMALLAAWAVVTTIIGIVVFRRRGV